MKYSKRLAMPVASISRATGITPTSNNPGRKLAVSAGVLACTDMQIKHEDPEEREAEPAGWEWTASRDATTSTSRRHSRVIQRWKTAPIWLD